MIKIFYILSIISYMSILGMNKKIQEKIPPIQQTNKTDKYSYNDLLIFLQAAKESYYKGSLDFFYKDKDNTTFIKSIENNFKELNLPLNFHKIDKGSKKGNDLLVYSHLLKIYSLLELLVYRTYTKNENLINLFKLFLSNFDLKEKDEPLKEKPYCFCILF